MNVIRFTCNLATPSKECHIAILPLINILSKNKITDNPLFLFIVKNQDR